MRLQQTSRLAMLGQMLQTMLEKLGVLDNNIKVLTDSEAEETGPPQGMAP